MSVSPRLLEHTSRQRRSSGDMGWVFLGANYPPGLCLSWQNLKRNLYAGSRSLVLLGLCDLFCNGTDGETKGGAGESNACAGVSPDPLCSPCSMPSSLGGCSCRKGFPSWISKYSGFQPPKGLNSVCPRFVTSSS